MSHVREAAHDPSGLRPPPHSVGRRMQRWSAPLFRHETNAKVSHDLRAG